MKTMKNRKGFSLIEMLIVIAIIAILVAIIVPVIGNSRNKAKGAVDAANVRTMAAEVATKRVSENDETKLLDGLNIVDSEIIPGSSVVFYVFNENEIRAYYTKSLLFTNQLRGTGYNSQVAETGKLEPPDVSYDTLEGDYRLLGALASDGNAYDADEVADIQDSELGTLIGNTAESVLEDLGLSEPSDWLDLINIFDSSKRDEVFEKLSADDAGGALKVALVDALVNQYGYKPEDAAQMVASGLIGDALEDQLLMEENKYSQFDDQYNEAISGAISGATDAVTLPKYNFSSYCGCTKSGAQTCTGKKSLGWGQYEHTLTGTWQCGTATYSEFTAYCSAYGLDPVNDHTHGGTYTKTVTGSSNCNRAHG